MALKTKINAEEGKQDLLITREFDLPLELLFKAYVEPEIVEEWMGTKVLKLENKKLQTEIHNIAQYIYWIRHPQTLSRAATYILPSHLRRSKYFGSFWSRRANSSCPLMAEAFNRQCRDR